MRVEVVKATCTAAKSGSVSAKFVAEAGDDEMFIVLSTVPVKVNWGVG
jgi:hypothetical protein